MLGKVLFDGHPLPLVKDLFGNAGHLQERLGLIFFVHPVAEPNDDSQGKCDLRQNREKGTPAISEQSMPLQFNLNHSGSDRQEDERQERLDQIKCLH